MGIDWNAAFLLSIIIFVLQQVQGQQSESCVCSNHCECAPGCVLTPPPNCDCKANSTILEGQCVRNSDCKCLPVQTAMPPAQETSTTVACLENTTVEDVQSTTEEVTSIPETSATTTSLESTTEQDAQSTAESCNLTVAGSNYTAIELENRLQNYAITRRSDCSIEDTGDDPIQGVVLNISNCLVDIQLSNFGIQCPRDTAGATLVIAQFSADSREISGYNRKKHQYAPQSQTRTTLLPPASNELLSISIIRPSGPQNKSVAISFTTKLPYTTLFQENAQDLTFHPNESGSPRTTYRYISHQPQCAFIDENTMVFNTSGCKCTAGSDSIVNCMSNHTTVFAVLLSVTSVEIPRSVKIVSIATQSVSILFLFVTFIILIQVRKKVRSDRIPVQINLAISLLLLNFCLVWGDIAVHNPPFCRAIAVLTQFFVLSTALWMMNEANLLFVKTSDWAFSVTKRRKVVTVTMLLGWGLPSIITIVTAAIGFANDSYMERNLFNFPDGWESYAKPRNGLEYEHCWLNSQNGMRWAAIGPVVFILAYNLIIAVRAAVFVYHKRIEAEKYKPSEQVDETKRRVERLKNVFQSLKAILLLLPVLGLPWIMLLLANSTKETLKLPFMYINAVIIGLQGVIIFIIYCVVDKKVKEATMKSFSSLTDTWNSFSPTRFQPNSTQTPK